MKFYFEPDASAFLLLSKVEKKLTFSSKKVKPNEAKFSRTFINVTETRILDSSQMVLLQDYMLEMLLLEEHNSRKSKLLYN